MLLGHHLGVFFAVSSGSTLCWCLSSLLSLSPSDDDTEMFIPNGQLVSFQSGSHGFQARRRDKRRASFTLI